PPPPPAPPAPAPPPFVPQTAPPRTCVNCHTQMAGAGTVSFRTGGYPGVGGVLGTGWSAPPEGLQPFSLYFCRQCGKFDLYYAGS
ncbi:MAG: hypothetical protein WB947_02265, partial [Thermoplasmata archaeon]